MERVYVEQSVKDVFAAKKKKQVCCAVERVYVEQSVKDVFAAKCLEQMQLWTMGDGMDPSSKVPRTKLLPKPMPT